MFSSWLLRLKRLLRPTRKPERAARLVRSLKSRPHLESLEDRLVPSAATHFQVLAPASVPAGQPAHFQLLALDASNHLVSNFSGTVNFTSTGSGDLLPKMLSFPASNTGQVDFTATLANQGPDTLTAIDGSITGNITVRVSIPAATHFLIAPSQVIIQAGAPDKILVQALDASNHLVPSYTGQVHFSSTDTAAGVQLPSDYTFQPSDHGTNVFQVTLQTPGKQTVFVTDTNPSTGFTSNVIVQVTPVPAPVPPAAVPPTPVKPPLVNPPPVPPTQIKQLPVTAPQVATHFQIVVSPKVFAGVPTTLIITALDASNQIVKGYTGTVNFTNTDRAATGLPASYAFQANDSGSHTFTLTFGTPGPQTVTAADASSGLNGNVLIQVAQALTFTPVPPPPAFGTKRP